MSHGDAVTAAPGLRGGGGQRRCARGRVRGPHPPPRRVQYHPEVMHSPHGQQVLSRFLHDFAGIRASWTPANIAESLIEAVRDQIGDGHAICGLSGEWTPRWPRRWFSVPSATG